MKYIGNFTRPKNYFIINSFIIVIRLSLLSNIKSGMSYVLIQHLEVELLRLIKLKDQSRYRSDASGSKYRLILITYYTVCNRLLNRNIILNLLYYI